MSQPWMPLYVGDYLRDTKRLTTLEHGAYMLLIMEYWANGGLPDDDERLARIVGLTNESWKCVRNAIVPLFGIGWHHKRIDEERKKAIEKSKKARASANNRWKNKVKLKNANGMLAQHSEGNATTTTTIYKENKKEKVLSPKEILEGCLSPETVAELIDHRKSRKCPLTLGAAKRLAKAFVEFGDPEKAAGTMILNGWKGFNPEWMLNIQASNNEKMNGGADKEYLPSYPGQPKEFWAKRK